MQLTRLQSTAAEHGCRARLQSTAAEHGCRARLQSMELMARRKQLTQTHPAG